MTSRLDVLFLVLILSSWKKNPIGIHASLLQPHIYSLCTYIWILAAILILKHQKIPSKNSCLGPESHLPTDQSVCTEHFTWMPRTLCTISFSLGTIIMSPLIVWGQIEQWYANAVSNSRSNGTLNLWYPGGKEGNEKIFLLWYANIKIGEYACL